MVATTGKKLRAMNASCVCSANRANALDAPCETVTLLPPIFALIVYRLGQEILNLQSGVRFPVGAPIYEAS